jgi:hypothetical protein
MLNWNALAIALHCLTLASKSEAPAPSVDGGIQSDSIALREMTVADAQRINEEHFLSSCRQAQWVLSAGIGWRLDKKRVPRNARLRDTKCLFGRCPPMNGRLIASLKLPKHVLYNVELSCCMDSSQVYLASTLDGLQLAVLWLPIPEQELKRSCR